MIVRSARWGIAQLVGAVALLAGIAVASVAAGPSPPSVLAGIVLPGLALVLGVLALFAGHVSYPRVQNLRVYLAGYSVGVQSIAFAVFLGFSGSYATMVPPAPAGYPEFLFATALLLCFAYTLLPPFPTLRVTRVATAALVGLQALLFAVARFLPAVFEATAAFAPGRLVSVAGVAAATLCASVVILNGFLKPQGFYLRGVFAGIAILAGGVWLLEPAADALGFGPVSPDFGALLFASVTPLFLIGSIVTHVLARMGHRAQYDPLLQIYNRDYCNTVIAEQSSVPTRPPLTVLMIDIDHFKQVNDTYGHQAGDRILFAVAQSVQKSVVPEGIVCRYGGEELIVFIPGRPGRDVVPLAQRLRRNVEQMETGVRANRISVTVSVGISDRRSAKVALTHVVHAADKALYIAKDNGRNQVRFVRISEPSGPRARGSR